MDELPYRAEYAKSGRASCRSCKSNIGKEVLRLAVLVQSPMFDGKVPHWYHQSCFFIKQRPKSVGDIAHFESLRWEDQEKIKKQIESLPVGTTAAASGSKKGKKRDSAVLGPLKDFTVEYAKSARATCRGCEQKIIKDEVRISKKDFESDVGKRYGGQDMWHHVECFAKLRDDLQFWASGTELPGFKALSREDQDVVKKSLPAVDPKSTAKDETDGPGPSKKIKGEKLDDGEERELKKQNKLIFRIRDQLKDELKKPELCSLLEYNGLQLPVGIDKILDRISDILAFGVPTPCKECKTGGFVFRSGVGYQCMGNLTEWVKCQNTTLDPERVAPKIPKELKEKYDFLGDYKYKPRKRVIRLTPQSSVPASATMMLPKKSEPMEVDGKPKVERARPPLYNMEFVILGKTIKDKDQLKKDIQRLGGKVTTKIHEKVFAVIANQEDVDRMGKKMELVEENQVDVVPEDFIQEVADGGAPLTLVKTKALSSWGSAPEKRVLEEKPVLKSRSGSMFTKSVPDKVKLKLKGGVAVDPDSGLEDVAHVYKKGSSVYTCVLSATDIQTDRNSYYKLQILQSDKGNQFWLFRSWGRIGTTIGGTKLEKLELDEAIDQYEYLFHEKSGNHWANHKNWVKIPGKLFPMEVSYGEEEEEKKKKVTSSSKLESKLSKPVQSLIEMLFDVDTMKKCMMEFELDLQKMPLGKISSKQILKAMAVLKDLQKYLENDAKDGVSGPNAFAHLVDGSNRFFTLIPHDFGVDTPPVLNTLEQIQTKIGMLESLLEIEIAYKMLDAGGDEDTAHPLDNHYGKLKADIEALDKTSEEYQLIEKYLKNSHAETHTQFDLVIEDVFKVKRRGEDKRYKPFKKLHNRQLLWHGSRLTNFVGIISQGLRIAPPEAPACGYMFGKGIYFADRVSKSANYCMTSKKNPTGLMLLCEVALGNMHERLQADYIEKLPKGKHSCKGVGRTQPDGGIDLEDGVHIPLGPANKLDDISKSLLYNEYIVYDVAQVQMKYLLKVNFKYK